MRVDELQRLWRPVALRHVDNHDAPGNADLDCRETESLFGVHGLQKIIHEPADTAIDAFHGLGDHLEARIGSMNDWHDRHCNSPSSA